MPLSTFNSDVHVAGTLSATTFTAPAGAITDSGISATANIAATKIIHRYCIPYTQANGTAVVAETRGLFICSATGAASLVSLEACITGAVATGGDRTVTIDLQKGNSGSAFASVLTSTIQFTNADSLRTIKTATINTSAVADNDQLVLVVTVAGAAGAQAQGLLVNLKLNEYPT